MTQGEFHQEKYLKILRKPLSSTGLFTYHRSKGVIWKTLAPIPSLLLINEAHLLTDQGEQAVPMVFGNVFKALLGGELDQLSSNFSITGEKQKNAWQLQFTPKGEMLKKVISHIQLTGDSELRSLMIQEVNGNKTQISFTGVTHPERLSSEQQADFERLSP